MLALTNANYLTPEEYLAWEAQSDTKHEYIDGEVYAMAGTTDLHNTIALNLAILLRNHLKGSGCQVYFADVKVRVERHNCYYYPDLFVTCNPQDKENATVKYFPKLMIEVLSPSTERFDRGDKFKDYRTLDSLEEYMLVNNHYQQVEIFRRNHDGSWRFESFSEPTSQIPVHCLDLTVAIADIYEEVAMNINTSESSTN